LQLSRVTRARAAPDADTHATELVFSAAVSMALDQAAFDSPWALPPTAAAPSS
jgi:hypothetical protein